MLFNKKRNKMIDVRQLQKRGVVRIPKKEITAPTTSDGFVELEQTKKATKPQSNENFFGFMENPKPETTETQNFSTSTEGYDKREVDQKVTDLDNKIYKLEQRIELLEKKLDVNQPSNNLGAMGW